MRKLLYTILISLLCIAPLHAGVSFQGCELGGAYAVTSDATPTDITLWWTCESNTLGASDYTAGDGVADLNDGAAINASAVKYGTNGLDCDNGWDNADLDISSDDIIATEKGRCGFWINPVSLGNFQIIFKISGSGVGLEVSYDTNGKFYTRWYDGVNDRYQNGSNGDISASSFQFIEIEWDSTTDYIKIWVDNSLKVNGTATIQAFTETNVAFGACDGNGAQTFIDNIMVSDLSVARDFYTDTFNGTPYKDLTESPR